MTTLKVLGIFKETTLKTAKAVVNVIMHRVFLAEFSWTGKAKPRTPRKYALQRFQFLLAVILQVVQKFHHEYQMRDLHNDMVNRIIKFAYE